MILETVSTRMSQFAWASSGRALTIDDVPVLSHLYPTLHIKTTGPDLSVTSIDRRTQTQSRDGELTSYQNPFTELERNGDELTVILLLSWMECLMTILIYIIVHISQIVSRTVYTHKSFSLYNPSGPGFFIFHLFYTENVIKHKRTQIR